MKTKAEIGGAVGCNHVQGCLEPQELEGSGKILPWSLSTFQVDSCHGWTRNAGSAVAQTVLCSLRESPTELRAG